MPPALQTTSRNRNAPVHGARSSYHDRRDLQGEAENAYCEALCWPPASRPLPFPFGVSVRTQLSARQILQLLTPILPQKELLRVAGNAIDTDFTNGHELGGRWEGRCVSGGFWICRSSGSKPFPRMRREIIFLRPPSSDRWQSRGLRAEDRLKAGLRANFHATRPEFRVHAAGWAGGRPPEGGTPSKGPRNPFGSPHSWCLRVFVVNQRG